MTWRNELNKNSMGGTEIVMQRLVDEFGDYLTSKFQVIPTRVRELQDDKIRILWIHDTEEDPECQHLANEGWKKFHKIVFVSHTQMNDFIRKFHIPYSSCTVIANSILPIEVNLDEKSYDRIELVYTPTPHRGLALLVPVFKELYETFGNAIHLHVYSSFKLYGWGDRDKAFEPLYDEIRRHDGMTYYGTVSNEELKESLKSKHIFAYPSIWKETGCICLMEAMSAGLACVHSSLGALPETSSNWTFMYDFNEDHQKHANVLYDSLKHVISLMKSDSRPLGELKTQKSYADLFYSWELRKLQWAQLLSSLELEFDGKDLKVPDTTRKFLYSAI